MTQSVQEISTEIVNGYSVKAIDILISYTPKILWALIVIWIGFKIAAVAGKAIEKILQKQKIELTIRHFLGSFLKNTLKVFVILAAVWILWVQTSSFIALFASMGFAIGMALSGTLGHFASGIMILLFKPYKVWDYIETAGVAWTVQDVQIFNTILTTLDNKTIIIPNSDAIGWAIINYSMQKHRRIDLEIWISYSDNIDTAKKVLQEIVDKEERIIDDLGHVIAVMSLWDNAVILEVKVWVAVDDYRPTIRTLTETIKKEFDTAWLNFPFPQRDMHVYNHEVKK